jgi:hypothetical protein
LNNITNSYSGFDLKDTIEPTEVTDSYYRFVIHVKPNDPVSFTVKELKLNNTRYHLGTTRLDQINFQKILDEKNWKKLEILQKMKSDLEQSRTDLNNNKGRLNNLNSKQDRIRKNLQSLGQSSDEITLRKRYVKELVASEDEIEETKELARVVEEQVKEMTQNYNKYLNEICFQSEVDAIMNE